MIVKPLWHYDSLQFVHFLNLFFYDHLHRDGYEKCGKVESLQLFPFQGPGQLKEIKG